MRWFWASVLLCCVGASTVLAQLKAGNEYITVIVDTNGQGLISIRKFPGTNLDPLLSYPNKSFVSINVGDKIFTNNKVGSQITGDPRFGGFLDKGVTQKVSDTIRTTWRDKNGCDIIQEVYPVRLYFSGQIVMRWKIKNNSTSTPTTGQAQFLLDVQVGAQNPNDGAPILTSYGYRPIWEQYTPASAKGIPWFFAAFENQLPNPPTFSTGITGVGYNQDVNYKLGLKKPILMTHGSWEYPTGAALVDLLWGISPSAPWGSSFTDAAMHFQWAGEYIPPGTTIELARTSYGTGEFGICTGQLFGIVFYPRRFAWKPHKYTPDTASVEFYAFDVYSPIKQDPNYGPPSLGTIVKLHCGPNLRIIEPGTGKTHEQQTQPADIPQYGVGYAAWRVVPDKVTKCTEHLTSWLKFSAQSSLSGTGPIFFNSGDGDTCEHTLTIDCGVFDTLAPKLGPVDSISHSGYQKFVMGTETRPDDRLIKNVTYTPSPGTDPSFKYNVLIVPQLTSSCTLDSVEVLVTQLDSTIGGCIDVTFTDCADNDTTIKICFATHTPKDVHPPVIRLDTTTRPYLRVSIRDSVKYDLGIDSVWFVPSAQTDTAKFAIGRANSDGDCPNSLYYEVAQLDPYVGGCFTVHARDCAGNEANSSPYCFRFIPASVEVGGGESIELVGNPASAATMLHLTFLREETVKISILDISGRVIHTRPEMVIPAGITDVQIPLADLAAGTYYIVAEWDGRQYAKKLSVVK